MQSIRLTAAPASVGEARRHVAGLLSAWARSHAVALDDGVAVLLVSEMATNAVLHARTDFTVGVAVREDGEGPLARIVVADGSPALPSRRAFSTSATTGRGLRLLTALARAWGTEPAPATGGKAVWADVAVRAGAAKAGLADAGPGPDWAEILEMEGEL